ncbi:hypothetical protein BDC45DRAFT_541563 [Circinella umbellata]|nr:hypothetical protein BDC45DRAFT_541563 [Circinella umbellata]
MIKTIYFKYDRVVNYSGYVNLIRKDVQLKNTLVKSKRYFDLFRFARSTCIIQIIMIERKKLGWIVNPVMSLSYYTGVDHGVAIFYVPDSVVRTLETLLTITSSQ